MASVYSSDLDIEGSVVRVPVNIKTGSMGRGGQSYASIAALHDQTRNLEVDMTWRDAVRQEFNLVLDPERHFFRRHEPCSQEHGIDSRISELLAEFKSEPKGDWKVTLVDVELRKLNNTVKRLAEANRRKSQNGAGSKLQPKKRKVEQRQGSSYSSATGRGQAQGHYSGGVSNVVHRQQESRGFPRGEDVREELVDDEDERDETSSLHSQDSQAEDLEGLGIPDEDFKSVFLRRIQQNMDGHMLLKAQAELKKQKATASATSNQRDQWTKWSLTCPYPVSIIRSLFDV